MHTRTSLITQAGSKLLMSETDATFVHLDVPVALDATRLLYGRCCLGGVHVGACEGRSKGATRAFCDLRTVPRSTDPGWFSVHGAGRAAMHAVCRQP
jgi:hypothetical protein